jgi:hypothetical protein
LDKQYGGFSGWVKKVLGFSDEDVKVIARNLGVSAP